MRLKLLAFAAAILMFAGLNAMRTHASVEHHYEPSALLPPSIATFRLLSHQQTDAGEVVGTYSDGSVTILLDVRPDTREIPHNGAKCLLITGEQPLKEDARPVRTARSTAVFDVALFGSGAGAKLVAATECYADKCAENPVTNFWHAPQDQPLVGLARPTSMVPVAILIDRSKANPGAVTDGSDLIRNFEKFVAGLDLTRYQSIAGDQIAYRSLGV